MDPGETQVQSRLFKWGQPAKEACVISLSVSFTGEEPQVQKHRMHILLAPLYVSLVLAPGCSSLPTRGDAIRNTINSITKIAQITLVHIEKLRTKLPATPQIESNTPSIEGLTSISNDLGLLDNELQSPFAEPLSQIQADVSSLEGWVRSLALTMDCPIRARARGETSDNLFPDTHLYLTLLKVQRYLEKFLLNKDKLKVC